MNETQQDQWTFEAVDRVIRATERTASSVETIKTILVVWLILSVIGAAVWIVAAMSA